MKYTTLLAIATAMIGAQAADSDWVTYTKDLTSTTIVVTRYLGTSELTGCSYTTQTVQGNGYQETVVKPASSGACDAASSSSTESSDVETSAAAASSSTSDAEWVTYTKDLTSTTIVVTRYLGTSELTGCSYTTQTVQGNGYQETVVKPATSGACDAVSSSSAESSAESSDVESASAALSTSTAVEDDVSTTVVTVTSCSDDACATTAVTTGVTVVTETSEGVVTEYTTYCPLTSSAAYTNSTTEAATSASTKASSSSATSTEAAVSTYEGAAAAGVVSIGALMLAAAALI